jgi:hypothetical protein
VPEGIADAQHEVLERALHESFVRSFRIVSWIAAALAALSAIVAWLTIHRK